MRETLEMFCRQKGEEIIILGRPQSPEPWIDGRYSVTSPVFQMHPLFCIVWQLVGTFPEILRLKLFFWQPFKSRML